MALISLPNVGNLKNNLIRRLKNDFIALRFIGISQDSESLTSISPEILEGWSYYPDFVTGSGQVTDVLKISNTPNTKTYLDAAVAINLYRADSSFTRFTLKVENKPKSPLYEWIIRIEPNSADQRVVGGII